jgi:hypothetical protein
MSMDEIDYKTAVQLLNSSRDEATDIVIEMKEVLSEKIIKRSFDYNKAIEMIEEAEKQQLKQKGENKKSNPKIMQNKIKILNNLKEDKTEGLEVKQEQIEIINDQSQINSRETEIGMNKEVPTFIASAIPGASSLYNTLSSIKNNESHDKETRRLFEDEDSINIDKRLSLINPEKKELQPLELNQYEQQPIKKVEPPKNIKKEVKPEFSMELDAANSLSKIALSSEKFLDNEEFAVLSQKREQPKKSELMQNFSLQDQISDLEKISEGLDEKVFDDEEIVIIKDEVFNLEKDLSQHKEKEQENNNLQLSQLRNALLQEVIKKLTLYNK